MAGLCLTIACVIFSPLASFPAFWHYYEMPMGTDANKAKVRFCFS
jgi:hypothetical protein